MYFLHILAHSGRHKLSSTIQVLIFGDVFLVKLRYGELKTTSKFNYYLHPKMTHFILFQLYVHVKISEGSYPMRFWTNALPWLWEAYWGETMQKSNIISIFSTTLLLLWMIFVIFWLYLYELYLMERGFNGLVFHRYLFPPIYSYVFYHSSYTINFENDKNLNKYLKNFMILLSVF